MVLNTILSKEDNINTNDFSSNILDRLLSQFKKQITTEYKFDGETKDKLIHIKNVKDEISSLVCHNVKLKDEKLKLEKQLKQFSNLPTDINQIKEMIKRKKQETKLGRQLFSKYNSSR